MIKIEEKLIKTVATKTVAKVPNNFSEYLNYLAGLYRGEAVSRSGKKFMYARPREVINTGWASWAGNQNIEVIYKNSKKRSERRGGLN